MTTTRRAADTPVVLLAVLGILGVSLVLQHEFHTRQALLFLVGTGLGITLYHAAFGFTGAWRHFVRERRGDGVRAQLWLFALTSLLFFPVLGRVFPEVPAAAALGPVSVSVLVGAFLFGIGMQLGGGCGSGTLFTLGGGHVRMLVTVAFFIVGATLGSVHLPWWTSFANAGRFSLIDAFGWWPALLGQAVVLGLLYAWVRTLELRHHGGLRPLGKPADHAAFTERLVRGPWPLWWGVLGLALCNLLTLLLAGHPWTITFAFGLWGTKIWAALGGDISTWSYWAGGYPARALTSSVLADITSVMDFGIILGAVLAAGLAGRFAPESHYQWRDLATAVIGGLLLGYGARLAFGCNIGALLAGIVSGSLHGWLWLAAGFAGTIVGVRLRVLAGVDPPVEKAT